MKKYKIKDYGQTIGYADNMREIKKLAREQYQKHSLKLVNF